MKKQPLTQKIKHWLMRFVQVQLFLTAMSAPILLSWGLPISLLSLLGNLIFFPVLVVFLMLSSIIFFFELLHIPNTPFIWCLEKLTAVWTAALSLAKSHNWLVGFRQPPILFLIVLPLLAAGIVYYRKTNPPARSIPLLVLLLLSSFGYLKLTGTQPANVTAIDCNGGAVTLVHSKGKTVLIDPGYIGRRGSASSWVEYTLSPAIRTTIGTNTVDHVIALQPGINTFDALQKLCCTMSVGTIYLPFWEGSLTKNGWRSFFKLKRIAQEYDTRMARLGNAKRTIKLPGNNHVIIESVSKQLHYQKTTYPAFCTRGSVDNEQFTLYAAQYKRMVQKGTVVENYVAQGSTDGT